MPQLRESSFGGPTQQGRCRALIQNGDQKNRFARGCVKMALLARRIGRVSDRLATKGRLKGILWLSQMPECVSVASGASLVHGDDFGCRPVPGRAHPTLHVPWVSARPR